MVNVLYLYFSIIVDHSKCFYTTDFAVTHSFTIHIYALTTMQGAACSSEVLTIHTFMHWWCSIRSNLGFSILLKDTLTCYLQGLVSKQEPSDHWMAQPSEPQPTLPIVWRSGSRAVLWLGISQLNLISCQIDVYNNREALLITADFHEVIRVTGLNCQSYWATIFTFSMYMKGNTFFKYQINREMYTNTKKLQYMKTEDKNLLEQIF